MQTFDDDLKNFSYVQHKNFGMMIREINAVLYYEQINRTEANQATFFF